MRAIAVTIAIVLTLLTANQLKTDTNTQTIEIDKFYVKQVNEFPDRTEHVKAAQALDAERAAQAEQARLAALEAARAAEAARVATITPPAPQIAPASPDGFITALGNCESGNVASRNSGNGYYGAFQFSIATWNAMGTGYARADLAPYEVQVAAVKKLLSRSSVHSQFPGCSKKLGL